MDKEIKIKSEILDAESVDRAISRISHEIVEKIKGAGNIVIIGIRQRGDILAARIAEKIKQIENVEVPVGAVDITFYRDDYDIKNQIEVHGTDLNFSVDDKDVVLVDDVLYTGRTTRAAIDVIIDYGRPKTIQLAVLVDRGHRELPIQANYVGKNVPTSAKEVIVVKLEDDIKVCLGERQ
ncbi:MAG: bifunctional pyr operon transcriptional regulator/uracil phosphoribosyltransferase PyrR [Bacteroidales bacterium]|jgi:pyrimidine operon attenuation protein/uracil phosphoribosyltransferase|nr:bifunctional pyr operon transcriptional regulator/uracil phosphoribosyltransferase PyrR [Bacteroidales bacterium]